jgi:hypothetical protein
VAQPPVSTERVRTATAFRNPGATDEADGGATPRVDCSSTGIDLSAQLFAPFRELDVDRTVADRAGRMV